MVQALKEGLEPEEELKKLKIDLGISQPIYTIQSVTSLCLYIRKNRVKILWRTNPMKGMLLFRRTNCTIKEICSEASVKWAVGTFKSLECPGVDDIFPALIQRCLEIISPWGDKVQHRFKTDERWTKVVFIPKAHVMQSYEMSYPRSISSSTNNITLVMAATVVSPPSPK